MTSISELEKLTPKLRAYALTQLPDATHIAMDWNGELYAYAEKPSIDEALNMWGGDCNTQMLGEMPWLRDEWRESLMVLEAIAQ